MTNQYRWPSLRAIVLCCLAAAVALLADAWFSAQEGYLARAPDYDGVGYLFYAEAPYHLIQHFHLITALAHLANNVAPLWTAVLTVHFLILGDGPWQAFAARFWPIALLLVLVYWIVRARANRALAGAAVGLTALLPIVSAGVRASSWEFLSGQANYNDEWGLDDLRPDFFAVVLLLCAVAVLAEHSQDPKRRDYLLSAAFAAAATLMKPSTAPVILVAWGGGLAVAWFWNRRTAGTGRETLLAAALFGVLLLPWMSFGRGLFTIAAYFYEAAVTYREAYSLPLNLVEGLTYYLVRIPAQVGQLEAWPVIAGSLLVVLLLLRRQLGRAEWIYLGLVVLFYAAFTVTTNKNPHVGEWFTLALWVFVVAGGARVLRARWPARLELWSPRLLGVVAAYLLVLYAVGIVALFNWPLNEQRANEQFASVTTDVAHELARHVTPNQCFSYAPGPGWPAALEILMTNSEGASPLSTTIDVDPRVSTVDYVAAVTQCPAVIVYREDVTEVAKVFFCPPVRQPYLRALATWVRGALSGYHLDRSWRFNDLPPIGPHTLGRYQGVSLTVDLYLRA